MPVDQHLEIQMAGNKGVLTTSWDIEDLPTSLQEMSDIIGVEAVQDLVRVYGGTRLTVPEKMPKSHPMAELMGIEAASKLSQHYALERLDVPRANVAIKRARNRRMRADRHAGYSVRQLAFRYRLTERRVWEILAEEASDARDQ